MTAAVEHPPVGATVVGYPRIGPGRELKKALEAHWAGHSDEEQLRAQARQLRADTHAELAAAGLDSQPVGTFSFYDHVLDVTAMVDAVPARFRAASDAAATPLGEYFAMARGRGSVAPLEMTKWFDTNYHYLVPELDAATVFGLADDTPVRLFREAIEDGVRGARPALLGPVTYLLLAKPSQAARAGFWPLELLDGLVEVYVELLGRLAEAGAGWVQLDESAFVADRSDAELEALRRAYTRLAGLAHRPRLLVTASYGDPGPALDVLSDTPVEGLGLDLVTAPDLARRVAGIPALRHKTVVAGLVDGRNVWRTDLAAALSTAAMMLGSVGELAPSTSCSLLHVPYDVRTETKLDSELTARLAFARQKLDEVVLLGRALRDGSADALDAVARSVSDGTGVRDEVVRSRGAAIGPDDRSRPEYAARAKAQQERLQLPPLATTTIGSFPQTREVRAARADWNAGRLDHDTYTARMRSEIAQVIRLQEQVGLDVLVHGEPERNDMVQYFAEHLDGFATTSLGWVQSYGSRCVRPPILHGDIARPRPITVDWSRYAQSLTSKPVKGMLTGPVTILAWSFVRDDQPLGETADQVALALRDELADLEQAGLAVVQVDEAALRETLPPRRTDQDAYLRWAVGAFRLATSGAAEDTQIHTHLCYSEFGDVISAIDQLDADVTTIEAARSRMEVLDDLGQVGFARSVGPGVYDIHSPRVPDRAEIAALIADATRTVPAQRLWINPDCGLKTRSYTEIEPALAAMVEAARAAR